MLFRLGCRPIICTRTHHTANAELGKRLCHHPKGDPALHCILDIAFVVRACLAMLSSVICVECSPAQNATMSSGSSHNTFRVCACCVCGSISRSTNSKLLKLQSVDRNTCQESREHMLARNRRKLGVPESVGIRS